MSWSGGINGLDPEVRAAYERVPWLERKASGWFILRVLNRSPRRAKALERYGPTGAVGLARMWAIYPRILVFGLLLTVISFFAYRRSSSRWFCSSPSNSLSSGSLGTDSPGEDDDGDLSAASTDGSARGVHFESVVESAAGRQGSFRNTGPGEG